MSDVTFTAQRPTQRPGVERNGGARLIRRRQSLPGGRAVVGGFLIAAAAVGIFAAYSGATADTRQGFLMARQDLPIGHRIRSTDFSVAFLGQRELTSAAAAAANDAATAIAERRFYQGGGGDEAGTVTLDEDRAVRVVNQALTARVTRGVVIDDVNVDPSGGQVCVVLRGRVDYVFAGAVPGMADGASVQGRASATAVIGPPGSPVVPRPQC